MSLVVKISARHKAAISAVSYLASNKNHHHNQRLVAGSVQYPGPLDKAMVKQVAADLDAYQKMTGTVVEKGHIYHVSLSASPENGTLPDRTWANISNDFMREMGFVKPGQPAVRWTAVNHGANGKGANHIHIVMSRVRDNGTLVSLHDDMKNASKVATRLERKYNLGVLQARLAVNGAGSVPFTGKEAQEARLRGRSEPDRVTLERKVRAAAAASQNDQQFIGRLGQSGVQYRAFPQSGPTTGYSVALNGSKNFLGGGKLARDLTLPQLRRSWGTQPQTNGANALKLEPEPLTVQQVLDGLTELGEQIQTASPEEFADLSHDLAATLAATSEATEDSPGELAGASREVGAWAQPRELQRTPRHGKAALMLFASAVGQMDTVRRTIMVIEVVQAVRAVYRLHQASRLMVGPERGMAMASAEQAVVAGSTAISRMTEQWHRERKAMMSGADARVQGLRDKQMAAVVEGPWDRKFIAESRRAKQIADAQERARARAEAMGPRATEIQCREVSELAAKVGLDIKPDHLNALSVADVEKMRQSFASVPGVALDNALADPSIKVPTGLGTVRTPEDADAFIRNLERKHGPKLDAKGVEDLSNVTNLPPAPASTSSAQMTGAKDPRNWNSAPDPVSKNQRYTLRAAGLTGEQIATLNKGEASFVIGQPDRQAAFEENIRTSPFKQPEIRTVVPAATPDPMATTTHAKPVPKPTLTQ